MMIISHLRRFEPRIEQYLALWWHEYLLPEVHTTHPGATLQWSVTQPVVHTTHLGATLQWLVPLVHLLKILALLNALGWRFSLHWSGAEHLRSLATLVSLFAMRGTPSNARQDCSVQCIYHNSLHVTSVLIRISFLKRPSVPAYAEAWDVKCLYLWYSTLKLS